MVQDVKMAASAIQLEALEQDPLITLFLAISALNAAEFTAGYSAHQWCFGKEYSLTDEDVRTFEAIPAERQMDFVKLINLRAKAEETGWATTVRQPLREFQPMDLVKVACRSSQRASRWTEEVGQTSLDWSWKAHQDKDDSRRHIVWVLVGSQLLRCSVHSVRPVTEVERFHFAVTEKEDFTQWKSLKDILPRREYVDLTDHEPSEQDMELPLLPPQLDATTTQAPRRRVTHKTTFLTGDYKDQPVRDRLRSVEEVNEYGESPPTGGGTASTSPAPATLTGSTAADYGPQELQERKKARLDSSRGVKRDGEPSWVDDLYMEAQAEDQYCNIFTARSEMNDVDIRPERLREVGPLCPREVAACRTALGGLQWHNRSCVPDAIFC